MTIRKVEIERLDQEQVQELEQGRKEVEELTGK
jgi:hypothetical protein